MVFDPVGLVCLHAETSFSVFIVFRVVAVKQDNPTVPFEGQDMGGDSIQKPAVMADDNDATGNIFYGLFESPHNIDVEIVGRFIKEEDVGPFLEHAGQVHPVALAPGHETDFFLLV